MNPTLEKFGFPDTTIQEYDHWVVMLRPKQVTLGSLVLAEKSEATSYGAISEAAQLEQKQVVADIEATLQNLFGAEKFNYLMLMMVDPNVHFHVLPRYSTPATFEGQTFTDTSWSGPPDLKAIQDIPAEAWAKLLQHLREHWQTN